MPLSINQFDHIHVPVPNREEAAEWYSEHLGFRLCEKLALWLEHEYAPLFLEDPSENVKVALVKTDNFSPASAIAFRCGGPELLEWSTYLSGKGILERVADHEVCWSLYFKDVAGNGIEITSYDYGFLSKKLTASPRE